MALYGEPQWAVVGDTFPVGCAPGKSVVFADTTYKLNPDLQDPASRWEDRILRILKRKNSRNYLQNLPKNLSSFETWNFLQHRIGHLHSKLRFRLDFNVMGTRRIHVSGVEKSSRMPATGRSVIHDSVSFVLSLAFRRGLLAFGWWKRPRHVLLDPGIQVLFSYSFSVLHFWSFRFFSSKFDLYSKSDKLPDIDELKPYYQSLIDKYVPGTVKF